MKLPFVLGFAKDLVQATRPILHTNTSENPVLAMLEKVIADRSEDAKDRIISLVDPDARTGHKSDMRKIQGYKDHILIDEDSEIILSVKVTPANAEDGDQLIDLVKQLKQNYDVLPKEISADKAYWFGKNLRFLNAQEIIGNISIMKTSNPQKLFAPEDFQFDRETMTVTCPSGKKSTRYKEKKDRSGCDFAFRKSQCSDCPLRSQCTTSKSVRWVYISEYFHELQQGREHYKTETYKDARKNRWIIERRHAR